MNGEVYTQQEFLDKFKQKYPSYGNAVIQGLTTDDELFKKIIAKYPSYLEHIKPQEEIQAGIKPPDIVEPEYPERPEYEEPPPSVRAAGWQAPSEVKPTKKLNRVSKILASVGYKEPTELEIIEPEYEEPSARAAGWQPPVEPGIIPKPTEKPPEPITDRPESYAQTIKRRERISEIETGVEDYKGLIKQIDTASENLKKYDKYIEGGNFIGTEEQYGEYKEEFDSYNKLVQLQKPDEVNKLIKEYNQLAKQELPVPIPPTYQIGEEIEGKDLTPADVGKAQKELMFIEYEEELRRKPKEKLSSPIIAFMDNIVWESPLGIAARLTGVPERTNIRHKVMNEKYPIESSIGSGLGTLYSFYSTIGVLQGTGIPLKLTKAAIRSSNYPKLMRMASTGVQGGLAFGAFNAIRNAIPYVEENKRIDLDYFKGIGSSVLLGTGLAWTALLKPVPHIIGSFAVGTGYGKLAGQDNIDAITTGGMFALFATFNLKNAREYDKAVAYSQSVHALAKKLSTSKVVADNFSPTATKKLAQLILNDGLAKHGGYDNFKSFKFDNFTKHITHKIQFINDKLIASGGKANVESITKYFKTTKIPIEATKILNKIKIPLTPKDIQNVDINQNPQTGKYLLSVRNNSGKVVKTKEYNTYEEAQAIATPLAKEVAKAQKHAGAEKIIPLQEPAKPPVALVETPKVEQKAVVGGKVPVTKKPTEVTEEIPAEIAKPKAEKQPWEMTSSEFEENYIIPYNLSSFPNIKGKTFKQLFQGGVKPGVKKELQKRMEGFREDEISQALTEGKTPYEGWEKDYPELVKPTEEVEPAKVPVAEKQPWEVPDELKSLAIRAKKYDTVGEFIEKEIKTFDDYMPEYRNPIIEHWRETKLRPLLTEAYKKAKITVSTNVFDFERELDIKLEDKYTTKQLENMSVAQKSNELLGKEWTSKYKKDVLERGHAWQLIRDFYDMANTKPEVSVEPIEITEKGIVKEPISGFGGRRVEVEVTKSKLYKYIRQNPSDISEAIFRSLNNVITGRTLELEKKGESFIPKKAYLKTRTAEKKLAVYNFLDNFGIRGAYESQDDYTKRILAKYPRLGKHTKKIKDYVNQIFKEGKDKALSDARREGFISPPVGKEGEILPDYKRTTYPVRPEEPTISTVKEPSKARGTGKIRIPSKALEGEGFPALKAIFGAKVARMSESGAIIKDYGQIKGVTVGGKTILDIESHHTNYDEIPETYTGIGASFDEILDEAHNEIDRFERGEISKTGKILKEKLSAKELFEAEEWGKTEEVRIKEAVTEVGGLDPVISESGKTVKFEVPKIGIKTVMRTKDIHYDDVAERIDKRLRESGIVSKLPKAVLDRKRKQIHLLKNKVGLSDDEYVEFMNETVNRKDIEHFYDLTSSGYNKVIKRMQREIRSKKRATKLAKERENIAAGYKPTAKLVEPEIVPIESVSGFDNFINLNEIKEKDIPYKEMDIAEIVRGNKTFPAIRRSGFFATKDFQTSPIRDIYNQSLSPYHMALKQDGYKLGGEFSEVFKKIWIPTQKAIRNEKTFISKRSIEIKELGKKHKIIPTKKRLEHLSDVIEGKIKSMPQEEAYLEELRSVLDDLRNQANLVREIMGKDKIGYIKDYIPHIQKTSLWNELLNNEATISDNLDFIIPNQAKNPFAYKRMLEELPKAERNLYVLLDRYIGAIAKDIYMTPAIENIKAYNGVLKSRELNNAARCWDEYIRTGLIGKQHKLDISLSIGQKGRKRHQKWNNMVNLAFLTGKVAWNITTQPLSYIMNVPMEAGIVTSITSIKKAFNKGLRQYVKENSDVLNIKSQDVHAIAVGEGRNIQNRIYQTKIDKWNGFLSMLSAAIERELTLTSYVAGLDRAKSLGYRGKEALWFADLTAARTQSMYNKENRALVLDSDILRSIFPFQSFSVEMFNHAKEILTKSTGAMRLTYRQRIGKLFRLMIGIALSTWYTKKLTGRRKTTIGTFIPFLGNYVDALTAKAFGKQYYGGRSPITVIQISEDIIKGSKDFIKHGNLKRLRKVGVNFGLALTGAGGGGQINNVIDGIMADISEEVKNIEGDVMFNVEDAISKIKAPIFGVWATKEGIEYWLPKEPKPEKFEPY